MNAPARQFGGDRADQRRRTLLAKVHIAKKQLGLAEDDYRAIVFDHCGALSAKNATEEELRTLVAHFTQRGFKSTAKAVPGRKAPAADFPTAKKARALWISLHQLGAVRNPSEYALEAFAKRQLRTEIWRWSDQSMAYRLIEALKAMAKRHGWDPGDSKTKVQVVRARLTRAILAKLVDAGIAHADWRVPEALFRLTGEEIREIDLSIEIEAQVRAAQLLAGVLAARAPTHNPEA